VFGAALRASQLAACRGLGDGGPAIASHCGSGVRYGGALAEIEEDGGVHGVLTQCR